MLTLTVRQDRVTLTAAPAERPPLAVRLASAAQVGIPVALVVAVPLVWNPFGVLGFETVKVTLIRAAAVGLLAAAAVLALHGHASGLRALPRGPLVAGLGLLVAAALAAGFSLDPISSLQGSAVRLDGLLTTAAFAFLGIAVATSRRRLLLLDTLLLASVPVALYALLQQARLDPLPWLGRTLGPASTVGSSTTLGGYLAMLLPPTLARGWSLAERAGSGSAGHGHGRAGRPGLAWRPFVFGLAATVQGAALLCTGVRGALFGAVAGLVCLVGLLALRGLGRGLRLGLLALLGLGGAAVLLLNLPGGLSESGRAASPYLERLGSLGPGDVTARERLLLWEAGLETLAEAGPRLLVGYGPESQPVILEPRLPVELARRLEDERTDRAHNLYLDLALSSGLFGLVAYLALLVTCAGLGWRALTRRRAPWLAAGLLAGMLAHQVEAAVAFPTAATSLVAWTYLGLLASLGKRRLAAGSRPVAPPPGALRRRRVWLAGVGTLAALSLATLAGLWLTRPIAADLAFTTALRHVGGKDAAGAAVWSQAAQQALPESSHYALGAGLFAREHAATVADEAERRRWLETAETSLRRAAALAPLDPYVHLGLAELLALRNEAERRTDLTPEAADRAAEAVQLAPSRPTVADAAAELAGRIGRPDLVLAWSSRARLLDGPNPARLAREGMAWLAQGLSQRARGSLDEALRLGPRSPEAHAGLATLARAEEQLALAVDHARQAVRFRQHDWRYRQMLAELEAAAGDHEAAVRETRAAARFAPPWEVARLRQQVEALRGR